ncbi:MAG TPA: cupin domain-containing protein [Burkholderiales bacterium]|nr:cupin domain-containing protein [Burkholderiales bacterium]
MQNQKFVISRQKESPFKPGFRSYFVDRDLGLREATGGRYMAEVHKACAPCPPGGTGRHLHKLDFQFNYVLKGWCRMEFEGEGEFRLEAGDTWLQPPGIKHTFIECSPDCEILEICSPGNFETVDA